MNWLTPKVALYACAALAALWLGTWGVMSLRLVNAQREASAAVATLERYKADAVEQVARFEREARESEQRHAKEMSGVAAKYEQEKRDAQITENRLVSDLRAGTVRLRQQWQGCESAARLPAISARAGELDAAVADRTESAARVVRVAAECDAQVRGLQAVVRADRGGL